MSISLNIKNSCLNGSPITVGEGDDIKVNICSQIENIDWEKLQDELIEVSAQLMKSSQEYKASKEALNKVMNKDKKGLIDVIKKNFSSFTSDIFTGIASGMLVEFLMSLI